jgi:two-component system nitrogen regulation response regulator NtrX
VAHEILIVDDEADIRMLISGILADEGYAVREGGDSDEALDAVRARRPNLVILDIWLKNSALDGLELLKVLLHDQPGIPVVMISGHGTIEMAVSAIRLGAYDFIEKPFKADRLLLVVQRAVEAARLRTEVEELRLRAGPAADLLGDSHAINQVRQAIQKVAPTGSRVLITGPPGAGKEVAARLLHETSRRAGGSFVALNCATMHPDRLEPSNGPTAGRFCSMKSPTCRSKPRARSCASCRSRPSSAWAGGIWWRSTSGSSPRPTGTCLSRFSRAVSARTCSTG